METEYLLDHSRKFAVMGPDEGIWYFSWESTNNVFGWYAYNRRPGTDIFVPIATWSEASVIRFLTKHSRKLTDSDRIDLYLFLYKGGIEVFLRKNRVTMKEI